ncbi:MAG: AraC-like DNA-binding protein [Paraglaciecola sp.]|jgi:AraC-like DNA-binding protein
MNSTLPLAQFSKFSSRNVEETRENVTDIFCPHQFKLVNGTQSFSTQVNEATFGQSALVYITYGTAVTIETEQLANYFLVQVPWQGSAEVLIEDSKTIIRPGLASVVSPYQAMRMRWSNDCSFYTVRLDRQKVEHALADLLGHELQAPLSFDPVFDLGTPEGKSWLNAVNFVRCQLELPLTHTAAAPLLQQLEDTLCLMLLHLPHHNYQKQLHTDTYAITPKSIKRAKDYIHNNIHQPISRVQLAEVAGVEPATLNKHFSHFIGQSPMKYVRGEKLAAVHKILQSCHRVSCVTDIALQFGFTHLGRFAEYYKRRYGELPSETYNRSK